MKNAVSRATVERIPVYLDYLRKSDSDSVSATVIARDLRYGEVQVRKDLNAISGAGRPRLGYSTDRLIRDLEQFMGKDIPDCAVIAGAGKLGSALLGYNGFEQFGVKITAAFDSQPKPHDCCGVRIFPVESLGEYCTKHSIKIGIITVPAENAQSVCDLMVKSGITAIWNFAPVTLETPSGITVINEKLAISLRMLRQTVDSSVKTNRSVIH